MLTEKIEALVKRQLKELERKESKTLVQFLDEEGSFICGYSEKPKQVNFYFQPLYDNPELYEKMKATVKPYLKGKSCLHFPKNDEEAPRIVEALLRIHKTAAP